MRFLVDPKRNGISISRASAGLTSPTDQDCEETLEYSS